MKQALLFSLCALCPLWLIAVGCASNGSARDGEQTRDASAGVVNFADARRGIRIVYGDEWKEQNLLKPRQAILLLARGDEVFSFVAQDKNADHSVTSADLPEMEKRAIEKYRKEFSEFKLLDQSDATLGTEPARRIVFTGKKLFITFQAMNVFAAHDGAGLAVIYMARPEAFEKGRADAEKMIGSVEFAPSARNAR